MLIQIHNLDCMHSTYTYRIESKLTETKQTKQKKNILTRKNVIRWREVKKRQYKL